MAIYRIVHTSLWSFPQGSWTTGSMGTLTSHVWLSNLTKKQTL